MYLYDIPQQYLQILENADPETGEIDVDALEKIQDSLHNKADAYGKVIQSLIASNEAIESEVDRLQDMMSRNTNKIMTLKENLMNAMLKMDDEKFKTDLFSFRVGLASSRPLIIDNSKEIPIKYTKTVTTVDKSKVKKDLEKGEKLDFAELGERKQYLVIK